MSNDFKVITFFPDGEPPENGFVEQEALSDKWMSICNDIYKGYGVVFRHNMGSTLSHFDIYMAGPMGRLSVNQKACFEISISLGTGSEQDKATIEHFQAFYLEACKVAKAPVPSEETLGAFIGLEKEITLLTFDYCNPEIDDQDKVAIGQLGLHLANAYYDFCISNQ